MSAVHRAPAYTKQGNDFFVNLTTLAAGNTYSYNETTRVVTSNSEFPAGFSAATIGAMLVKDLGKTVRYNGGVYRKVQANSLATATSGQDFTTYIQLTLNDSNVGRWARVTVQA